MNRAKIRSFTERGMGEFRDYLGQGPLTAMPPPTGLLFDDRFAVELGYGGELPVRQFQTKFDMGMTVAATVGKENLQRLFADENAWPWLSLLFSDTTMPRKGDGWFLGTRSRHMIEKIPGRQQDQSHRHLVKAATINVARFGTHARVLMDRPDGQSKIEEQVMSRKADWQLSSSESFVRLLNRLYWDSDSQGVRRGARGNGPGSVPRLIKVLEQLDRTYDIPSMTPDEISNLLPIDEFGKFLNPKEYKKERQRTASNAASMT